MNITVETIKAAHNRLRFRRTLVEALCKLGGGPQTWEQARTMTLQEAMVKLGSNGLIFFAAPPAATPGPGSPPTSLFSADEMLMIFEEIKAMEAESSIKDIRQPAYVGPANPLP